MILCISFQNDQEIGGGGGEMRPVGRGGYGGRGNRFRGGQNQRGGGGGDGSGPGGRASEVGNVY